MAGTLPVFVVRCPLSVGSFEAFPRLFRASWRTIALRAEERAGRPAGASGALQARFLSLSEGPRPPSGWRSLGRSSRSRPHRTARGSCAPTRALTAPPGSSTSRFRPPARGEHERRYMGKTWIPVTIAAGKLGSIVGSEAERGSFIKLDIEGAEAAVAPEIPVTFSHPGLVVALLA